MNSEVSFELQSGGGGGVSFMKTQRWTRAWRRRSCKTRRTCNSPSGGSSNRDKAPGWKEGRGRANVLASDRQSWYNRKDGRSPLQSRTCSGKACMWRTVSKRLPRCSCERSRWGRESRIRCGSARVYKLFYRRHMSAWLGEMPWVRDPLFRHFRPLNCLHQTMTLALKRRQNQAWLAAMLWPLDLWQLLTCWDEMQH